MNVSVMKCVVEYAIFHGETKNVSSATPKPLLGSDLLTPFSTVQAHTLS